MAVRATRLAGPAFLPATAGVVYTVAAGRTALIRALRVVNVSGVAQTFTLTLGDDLVAHSLVPPGLALAAGGMFYDTTRNTLLAGESLRGVASTGTSCVIWVSGSLLLGVPT